MACAVEISNKGANMYQKIASKRKSLFSKGFFELAGAAIFIILALFLAGCSTGVGYDLDETASDRAILGDLEDPPSIEGTWKLVYDYDIKDGNGNVVDHFSGYEQYVITGSTLSYIFHDSIYDFDYADYTVDIVELNLNEDDTSGVIIIHYGANPPYGDTPGYYNAVYFDDLTETTVYLANAVEINDDNASAEVATFALAHNKFIWDDFEDYVNWDIVKPQIRQP
jgi:hypothetical protein